MPTSPRRTLPLALLLLTAMGAGPCGSTDPDPACRANADCGYGQYCAAGTCKRYLWFCATPSVSMNDRGEWRDCDVYRCDSTTGRCLEGANGSGDCANGALFEALSYNCICPGNTACGGSAAPAPYDLSDYPPCDVDADCGAGKMCWRNPALQAPTPICVGRAAYCGFDADGSASVTVSATLAGGGNLGRTVTSCGSYQCDVVTGGCLDYCTNSLACQAGSYCQLCVAGGSPCDGFATQVCTP